MCLLFTRAGSWKTHCNTTQAADLVTKSPTILVSWAVWVPAITLSLGKRGNPQGISGLLITPCFFPRFISQSIFQCVAAYKFLDFLLPNSQTTFSLENYNIHEGKVTSIRISVYLSSLRFSNDRFIPKPCITSSSPQTQYNLIYKWQSLYF